MKILTFPCGALMANMYVVYDENTHDAIVIDPIDAQCLERAVATHFLIVRGILLTHAHYDHAVELEQIKSLTRADAYIHKDDQPLLSDPMKNASAYLGYSMDLGQCDRCFSDNDTLALGSFSVTVLHTPGHTPGSCCFLIEDAMFSGDTIFADGIGRCDLYGGNLEAMRQTLQRLLSLSTDYQLYPGHGHTSRLSRTKNLLRYYTES